MIVFAANEGYLDEVAPDRVQEFEQKFIPHLKSTHPEIAEDIRKTRDLTDATKTSLKGVLKDFVEQWKKGLTSPAAKA